jgi:hypothetical protein
MTKNPYLNAGAAALYIACVVLFMQAISHPDTPDTWFAPVIVLTLLTFSAAFMAYAFFFQPMQMFLDGQKKEAAALFTRTLVSFGLITVVVLALGLIFS